MLHPYLPWPFLPHLCLSNMMNGPPLSFPGSHPDLFAAFLYFFGSFPDTRNELVLWRPHAASSACAFMALVWSVLCLGGCSVCVPSPLCLMRIGGPDVVIACTVMQTEQAQKNSSGDGCTVIGRTPCACASRAHYAILSCFLWCSSILYDWALLSNMSALGLSRMRNTCWQVSRNSAAGYDDACRMGRVARCAVRLRTP